MALLALTLTLLGVRGHIPRFDDFRPIPAPNANMAPLFRAMGAIVALFAVLALAIWVMVWFAVEVF